MLATKQYPKNDKWDTFVAERYSCPNADLLSGSWTSDVVKRVIIGHTKKSRFSIAEDVGWEPMIIYEKVRQKFKDSLYIEKPFESSALNIRENEDQATISKRKFKNLISTLIKEYYGKYLAVVGNHPYEIGDDEDELFDRVTDKYGDVPMCIGRIIESEKSIDIEPPKIAI